MDKKILSIIALLCTVIQGMWAQTTVSLTEDTGEDAGTAARWFVNMPATGTNTLTLDGTITTFKVYDDGGKDGTYSNNCDGTLVLTAPNGYVLQLSGSISSEDDHYLNVYDGSDNQADKLIDGACGNNGGWPIDIPTVISNGQSMTLCFKTIGSSYQRDGLNLTVTLINTNTLHDINGLETVSNGSITAKVNDATVTQAKFRDVVALTASPDDGYVLSNLSVKDASNNDVSVSWLIWSNNATFTMPPSAVTVTPTFTHKNSLSVNMPVDGVKTVRIPAGVQTFKVYDDGGSTIRYSNNCRGTLVLTAPEGYVLQLSGGIATHEGGDYLTVYDNNEASGTELIDAVSGWGDQGNLKDITTVTSTGNNMTLYFYSDITNNYTGLDLTVLVYNPTMEYGISGLSNTTNGSIAATVGGNAATGAKWNDEVILSATPVEGYVLDALSVVDENSNAVDVTWNHWENSASFTMPLSAVTVTSTFTSKNSLSINMPTKATRNVTIPAGVSSFKVYDDGGAGGNYSNGCDGTLVLTAPVGCRLQLSGTILSYSDDNLSVYNGSDKSAPILINEMHSTGNAVIETTSISTVSSTGRSMTLYFHTDGYYQLGGLDLTVTVLDASAEYTINGIGDVTNGSIAATVGGEDVTKAKLSDVVTLTVTPADNYVLSDLSVVDANSETVSVTRDFWANTATFTMPASEVTVTPTFTNDIFVNMPKTGEKTVTIPANVHWFKVYDDGGKDDSYDFFCNGTLVLTAPEGYQLQLSGNITTDNVDYLTVYDGDQADNEHILINQAHSSSSGTSTAISTVFSAGRSMRLYFYSDNGDTYAGLDLTVTVIDPNRKYDISGLGSVTNGSITATVGGINVTQSKASDVVTLTVAPDKGYVLTDLSVVDGSSNPVTVTRDFWANTATFTMPASAVTVTPTLTNNLNDIYINMPKTGTTTVTIPAGVQSFKVYGDRGSGNYYSDNCNGYLVLNAPEGYVLQVSGRVEIPSDPNDYLIVYDGTNDAADVLIPVTSGYNTDIPTKTSSGRSMTISFVSNSSTHWGAGLNLTVTQILNNEVGLANDADNSTIISNNDGKDANVTLVGRTLTRSGEWNTLCLPFNVSAAQMAETTHPLYGTIIKELNTSTSNLAANGQLTLNFETVTAIEAGKPYIVKWTQSNPQRPIFSPSNEFLTALGFINEVATVDCGQNSNWNADLEKGENYNKLIDGNTSTKYGLSDNDPYVEFHYPTAITPKGYALWTANDEQGRRNPVQWTIMAKNEDDAQWTTLVTVDNTANDKLPLADNACTVFALNNTTAYTHFRFEATRRQNGNKLEFQLAELQFCTEQPSAPLTDITNPVFNGVTISSTTPTPVEFSIENSSKKCQFLGQYSPFSIGDTNSGTFDGDLNEIVMLGSGSKLGYSKNARTLKTFRCHFYVPADGGVAGARAFVMNFEEGETTGIITMSDVRSEMSDGWYTIDGRKLSGKPSVKGVYVNNGRKVIIK